MFSSRGTKHTVTCADCNSDITVPPRTKAEGCASQLVGAVDPAIKEHNGALLLFCQPLEPEPDHAKGEENERRFWELSEKLANQEFK